MVAWGFEYRDAFAWCKPQLGCGNYWRVSHEFMLLGVRGDALFASKTGQEWPSHLIHKRGRHSAKPDCVRDMIEDTSDGPYLELFGRKTVPGWCVFGNQVEKTLFA